MLIVVMLCMHIMYVMSMLCRDAHEVARLRLPVAYVSILIHHGVLTIDCTTLLSRV